MDIEKVEAAAQLLKEYVSANWQHGHASFHISNRGDVTVYVHRYNQCEIGSAKTVAVAMENVLKAANASWPSEEVARALKVQRLRGELAAAEAELAA